MNGDVYNDSDQVRQTNLIALSPMDSTAEPEYFLP